MAPHASAEVRRLHRGRGEATSTQVVGPWGRRCKWTVSYQGPEKPQPQLPCPGRSPCMPHPAGQPQGEEQDAVFTTETIRLYDSSQLSTLPPVSLSVRECSVLFQGDGEGRWVTLRHTLLLSSVLVRR